jgi:hypothetical protein
MLYEGEGTYSLCAEATDLDALFPLTSYKHPVQLEWGPVLVYFPTPCQHSRTNVTTKNTHLHIYLIGPIRFQLQNPLKHVLDNYM